MTIFLMVLKDIIKAKLSKLESHLDQQPTGAFAWLHNKDLSKAQRKLISELRDAITTCAASNGNNDAQNALNITKLINDTLDLLNKVREKHKKSDDGKTVTELGKITNRIAAFTKKMDNYKFKLVDKPFTMTPENWVYYHAIYYLGDNLFVTHAHDDPAVRALKEKALAERLLELSLLIKPTYTFAEQKKWALKVLKDIDGDNAEVVNDQKSSIEVPLSYVTMFGIGITAPLAAGKGRLADATKLARATIDALTEDKCACPRTAASSADAAARAAAIVAAREAEATAKAEADAAKEAHAEAEASAEAALMAKAEASTKARLNEKSEPVKPKPAAKPIPIPVAVVTTDFDGDADADPEADPEESRFSYS